MSIILNIPFNEPFRSVKASDYSGNGYDATIEGARFVPGREGNAIHFTGSGIAEISQSVFSLGSDFTTTFWVKPLKIQETLNPKSLIILFNFSGISQFLDLKFNVSNLSWSSIAISRSLEEINVYVNLKHVETLVIPQSFGALEGFSVLQDYYGSDYGYADVYNLKSFSTALTLNELKGMIEQKTEVQYLLDRVNFKEWDVFVSASTGIIDGLKMKDPFRVEWSDEHGEVIDLSRPRFDVREIVLNCFMKADGKQAFLLKSKNFLDQFQQQGTRRLAILVHPEKPLVYEVYCKDGVAIEKTWNDELMIGTFQLKLREPEPVKRVLKYTRTSTANKTVTITLSSNKLLNIYWGDGTKTLDVYGFDKTITHDYSDDGEYHIIVAGVIEDITSFTTNAIIAWNKL